MLSIDNILETNQMIHDNKLDVRTITMGISLLECASSSGKELCDRIYKILSIDNISASYPTRCILKKISACCARISTPSSLP